MRGLSMFPFKSYEDVTEDNPLLFSNAVDSYKADLGDLYTEFKDAIDSSYVCGVMLNEDDEMWEIGTFIKMAIRSLNAVIVFGFMKDIVESEKSKEFADNIESYIKKRPLCYLTELKGVYEDRIVYVRNRRFYELMKLQATNPDAAAEELDRDKELQVKAHEEE